MFTSVTGIRLAVVFAASAAAIVLLTDYSVSSVLLPVFLLLTSMFHHEDNIADLRASEERCRLLTETARVYIHHFTPEGIVTYMNAYAEEISGYSREEIIGKNFMDIFVPEYNRETVTKMLEPVFAGAIAVDYEAPMLTKSGEERIMLWSGAPIMGANGEPEGIVASGLDVTDRKQIQQDLIQSKEQYCALINDTPVAVVVVSGTGIVYANRRFRALTGYSRKELSRMEVSQLVHPAESDRLHDTLSLLFAGQPVSQPIEYRLKTKTGEERIVQGQALKTVFDGQDAVLASVTDITDFRRTQDALRNSELLYRTLVDRSLAGVFVMQDASVVFTNKRAREILGYTREEIERLSAWDLVHPDDRAMVMDRAMRRLNGERVAERYEYRLMHKNGQARLVESWSALIEYKGTPAILASFLDVTERQRTEELRLEAERELERHKRRLHSQAITALTRGKLEILEPEQMRSRVAGDQLAVEVSEHMHVRIARHMVKEFVANAGLEGERLNDFVLAVGEATVNAVKHAGAGTVTAGRRNGVVWVAVADKGPGMDSFVLTQAALSKGFSTKPSLGLGYSFILDGSDHVVLATSPEGTIVEMEKNIDPPKSTLPIDISRIPDLW